MIETADKTQMSYLSKSSTKTSKQNWWWWFVHQCEREKLKLLIVIRCLKMVLVLFFLIFKICIAWDYMQQIRTGSHLICFD